MLVHLSSFGLGLEFHVSVLVLAPPTFFGPLLGGFLVASALLDDSLEDVDSLPHGGVELTLHTLNVELYVLPEGDEHVEGLEPVLRHVVFVHL